MSQLLRTLTARIRHSRDPLLHVVAGSDFAEEEAPVLGEAEPRTAEAKLVDPRGSLDGLEVGDPTPGRFTCFMDGMERQRLVLYYGAVPIVYGFAAAVVRRRGEDRKMLTDEVGVLTREALYGPRRLVDFDSVFGPDVPVSDIELEGELIDEHPIMLREAARRRVGVVRESLERDLISRWLERYEGSNEWLLVDGSLAGNYDRYHFPCVVGVVKSHQTQYFSIDQQAKVLALREGERSGVFIPRGRNRPEVYSWYLRLRSNEGRDVYFGLVRVEAPRSDRTLEMADEISRWLLAERSPVSLPDSRWDRLIYPIRDCEQYLRSIAPTGTFIEASLGGLARSR